MLTLPVDADPDITRLEEPPYQSLVEIHMDYFRNQAAESEAMLRVEKAAGSQN